MYIDGKTQKEIVQEQNIELQTVKNNISIALKVLRSKLQFLAK
jgi:RNA polymerase sigma-70 factor (ECF subfamily)